MEHRKKLWFFQVVASLRQVGKSPLQLIDCCFFPRDEPTSLYSIFNLCIKSKSIRCMLSRIGAIDLIKKDTCWLSENYTYFAGAVFFVTAAFELNLLSWNSPIYIVDNRSGTKLCIASDYVLNWMAIERMLSWNPYWHGREEFISDEFKQSSRFLLTTCLKNASPTIMVEVNVTLWALKCPGKSHNHIHFADDEQMMSRWWVSKLIEKYISLLNSVAKNNVNQYQRGNQQCKLKWFRPFIESP